MSSTVMLSLSTVFTRSWLQFGLKAGIVLGVIVERVRHVARRVVLEDDGAALEQAGLGALRGLERALRLVEAEAHDGEGLDASCPSWPRSRSRVGALSPSTTTQNRRSRHRGSP